MDEVLSGIRTFLDSEEKYEEIGIPYHMGILLYGPPGTGKSSTLSAIANEFGLDIAFISLGSLQSGDALENISMEIEPGTLVVLEDIDAITAASTRDHQSGQVDTSALLNVLDGPMSPHGCVFALTTNHIENLDPAVIRSGRIEYQIELGYMDNYQLKSMCKSVFKDDVEGLPEITEEMGITPSDIVDVIRDKVSNLDDAKHDVIKYVQRRAHGN